MHHNYTPVPHTLLDAGTGYQRPRQNLPEHVSMDSPAMDVMTDLSVVAAVTVAPSVDIDEAERRMIASGIRLLLVTNSEEQIEGIVTARDLSGERLLSLLNRNNQARSELTVHDIMTPRQQIEVLEMGDVIRARVGDLVETLKRMGRQHALVVDRGRDGHQTVRGILSTTQIGRQLGRPIEVSGMAHSMAGLVQTVAASQDKAH
jgi:CBS-domain-containing membrane protein